jgi:hypothetical protein
MLAGEHAEDCSMLTGRETASSSKILVWTGRVVSAIPSLFMLLDGVMKLLRPEQVVEATGRLGYSESVLLGLGIVQLVCVALYVIPYTAVLGAILLTGYLGGAVASHLRVGDEWFPVLFPVLVGVLVWGGLWLRDARLRGLVPLRS